MANLNRVLLMGNLTRDVKLSYLPSSTAVAELGMAVNRNWVGQDGQKHEEVTFVDLVMYGKRAEILNKYLHKGDPLFVEGRLKLDSWDDKQTGQKRSKMRVMIENFEFLGRGGGSRDGMAAQPAQQRRPAAPPASESPSVDDYSNDIAGEPDGGPGGDDIPF